MLDYYKILGISRSADYVTIRSAYKKLALQYHPDRNPDNKAAEEYFKVINEAKQLLSNPQKRAQYDLLLNYVYEASHRNMAARAQNIYRYAQARNIYQGYRGSYGQTTYEPGSFYRIDKNYYKVQLLTLMVVALISIFSIGLFEVNKYLEEKKQEEIRLKNEKVLTEAQALYDEGYYRRALNMVIDLIKKNPIEPKFYDSKENMVASLNNRAISLYQKADYEKAVENLEILREYQRPMRLSTWTMIADCNYKLGNYRKAVHALEYVRIRDKTNLELVIRIGDIYFDDLHMVEKALEYYTQAKYMFKEFHREIYGEAFELVMPVQKTPQIYFDMFSKRAEINTVAGNYEDAVTDYNWAIYLRPDNPISYHKRAACLHKTGHYERACNDWQRALTLGHQVSREMVELYCR